MKKYEVYENGRPTNQIIAQNFDEVLTKLDEKKFKTGNKRSAKKKPANMSGFCIFAE